MFQKISAYISALALALTLTACATPGGQTGEVEIRSGVIEQITPVQIQSNQQAGVGAVVGGLAGLGCRPQGTGTLQPAGCRTADHRPDIQGRPRLGDPAGQCQPARGPEGLYRRQRRRRARSHSLNQRRPGFRAANQLPEICLRQHRAHHMP